MAPAAGEEHEVRTTPGVLVGASLVLGLRLVGCRTDEAGVEAP
jgi:hypothetical protein